jgi:hypothetical protein
VHAQGLADAVEEEVQLVQVIELERLGHVRAQHGLLLGEDTGLQVPAREQAMAGRRWRRSRGKSVRA